MFLQAIIYFILFTFVTLLIKILLRGLQIYETLKITKYIILKFRSAKDWAS